jgi:hypothetical protein
MVKKIVSNSPKFIKNALTNKYVLYLVLIVSVGNILGYIEANDFDALALFMASGFVMSYFSKNMIIILGIAMFFGNCKVCASALNSREGFKEGATSRAGKKDTVRSQKSTTLYNVQEGKCVEMKKGRNETCKKSTAVPKGAGKRLCFTCDDWGTKCGKQKKPKGCKKKSGFTQRSEPEKLDESKRDNTEVDVNYGAALETAFNTLGNIGGKNGLENIGNTTRQLVDTQEKLLESIQSMGPSIMQAKEALETMDLPDMNKISSLLEKMNSGSLSGLMAK